MEQQHLFKLYQSKQNLQYITGTDISFDSATKTITDVHAVFNVFSVGTKFSVTGTGEAGNQTTFTVATIASNYKSITVEETVTDDAAGDTIYINEFLYGDWVRIAQFDKIVAGGYASQIATLYVDQSEDGVNIDYTSPVATWTAGGYVAYEIDVTKTYGRIRILNGGTDQTATRFYLSGKI